VPVPAEPYQLRVWQGNVQYGSLQHQDRIRIAGGEREYSARVRDNGIRLREITQVDGVEELEKKAAFYDESVLHLAEAGLLERLLLAEVQPYDVWANDTHAYSFRGGMGWRDLIALSNLGQLDTDELPYDLTLVWRRSKEL
jgi:hypothetical protein